MTTSSRNCRSGQGIPWIKKHTMLITIKEITQKVSREALIYLPSSLISRQSTLPDQTLIRRFSRTSKLMIHLLNRRTSTSHLTLASTEYRQSMTKTVSVRLEVSPVLTEYLLNWHKWTTNWRWTRWWRSSLKSLRSPHSWQSAIRLYSSAKTLVRSSNRYMMQTSTPASIRLAKGYHSSK